LRDYVGFSDKPVNQNSDEEIHKTVRISLHFSEMSQLAITNGMIWDGIHTPFLGTLVCSDRIISIHRGTNMSIPDCATILDAKGGSVIPAFTDVHQHFSASVLQRSSKFVLLDGAHSLAEAVSTLITRSQTTAADEWIVGVQLNHNQFTERRLPTRDDLDAIPNPVLVTHSCGHNYFINSRAIDKVGESSFAGIPGVGRDSNGRMTGVLEDGADAPLRPHFTSFCEGCVDDWMGCSRGALELGIAEVHAISADIVLAEENVRAYETLRDSGKLGVRIRVYLTDLDDTKPVVEDDWLSYGGHKIFVDGAFGGRTAAMRHPFGDVDRIGILRYTDEKLYETIKKTFEHGVQLMAHVVGDRGLDQLLSVLERLKSEGVTSDWPVKLVHCELCHPDQVARIARLGAFCDMQPGQLISEASFLPAAIGLDRMQHCFPFRSLIDAGVTVVGSSDAPVDPADPMIGIHAAVVRHSSMNLDERISLHEALQMYTINAQKLIKNDDKKGLLKVGLLADITVFQDDLFAVAPECLADCKVAATIVNGQIAYGCVKGKNNDGGITMGRMSGVIVSA
jgi:predicted amidohydrolase YtcJ